MALEHETQHEDDRAAEHESQPVERLDRDGSADTSEEYESRADHRAQIEPGDAPNTQGAELTDARAESDAHADTDSSADIAAIRTETDESAPETEPSNADILARIDALEESVKDNQDEGVAAGVAAGAALDVFMKLAGLLL
jgi:hypothetical protein